MSEKIGIRGLIGRVIINGKLDLLTGLHIGDSGDYSAIGAVDSVVVRNPVTKEPYIPGSSLKGKMRYLLSRVYAKDGMMLEIEDEDEKVKRLFGVAAGNNKDSGKVYLSRLQFSDIFFNEKSKEKIEKIDTGLYLTEIKFENSINRLTAIANPRQNERVVAGSEFDFKLVYNIENLDELDEDLANVANAMSLLEDDYLGGHGTRGYGRVKFKDIDVSLKTYSDVYNIKEETVKEKFENWKKSE